MSLLLLFGQPPYHKALLETAKRLLSQNEPAVALVTAHMACEIYSEQMISLGFQKRALGNLEKPLRAFVSSNNLAVPRVRKLYFALTGDPIEKTPFWERFTTSRDLRNDAVHHGAKISMEQGRDAYDTAREFVAHMDAVAKTLR